MTILKLQNVDDLPNAFQKEHHMAILERETPNAANNFFKQLTQKPFGIFGNVSKDNAKNDIKKVIESSIPKNLQADSFYQSWVLDMAKVCQVFCLTYQTEAIGFWLGSERGCRRYHLDNVKMRLLVTYFGKGTEWLLDEGADREAYKNGAPNNKIVIDKKAIRYVSDWDIAVFRGGPDGVLHRTPDEALTHPSIIMRLDHPAFWEMVLGKNCL